MSQEFLGKGLKFPIEVDSNGALATSEGEDKIRGSVLSILSTALGERVMRPDFGSEIHNQVFATINTATISSLSYSVQEALIKWEPRIRVENIQVSDEKAQDGILLLSIDYRVRSTNTQFNLVYPFYIRGFSD